MEEVVGKSASKPARKGKYFLSGGLSCFLVLGLATWPGFNNQLNSIEHQVMQAFASVKQRVLNSSETEKQQTRLPAVQQFFLTDKLIESKTSDIYSKLAHARQELAAVATLDSERVWVSFYQLTSDEIVVLPFTKDQLRQRGATFDVMIKETAATLVVDEPNGVNTKLSIKSDQYWVPLTLAYPIDRGGLRMAYYTPAHYQLRTDALVADGKAYISNHIVNAKAALSSVGLPINDTSSEMAAKLSVVEHVDHSRFVNEPHRAIFDEIYTLYALNRGETYRYSISVAGAGGMIQMIPSTFRLICQRYPQAGLNSDFVTSMSDHSQAMKAMLLYLSMTHEFFQSNSTVSQAMTSAIARVNDLMAAGYNSNPARLPGYINSHNLGWTNVIPRETKIYLTILRTLENPDEPQIELAREYLRSAPITRYRSSAVASSVNRSSRFKSQVVGKKSRGKYRTRLRAR